MVPSGPDFKRVGRRTAPEGGGSDTGYDACVNRFRSPSEAADLRVGEDIAVWVDVDPTTVRDH